MFQSPCTRPHLAHLDLATSIPLARTNLPSKSCALSRAHAGGFTSPSERCPIDFGHGSTAQDQCAAGCQQGLTRVVLYSAWRNHTRWFLCGLGSGDSEERSAFMGRNPAEGNLSGSLRVAG